LQSRRREHFFGFGSSRFLTYFFPSPKLCLIAARRGRLLHFYPSPLAPRQWPPLFLRPLPNSFLFLRHWGDGAASAAHYEVDFSARCVSGPFPAAARVAVSLPFPRAFLYIFFPRWLRSAEEALTIPTELPLRITQMTGFQGSGWWTHVRNPEIAGPLAFFLFFFFFFLPRALESVFRVLWHERCAS